MSRSQDGKEHDQKNVLLVSQRSVSRYGVQIFLLNIVENAPPPYHFTWYCPGLSDESFAEEFRRLGIRVVTGGLNLFQCSAEELYDRVATDIRRLSKEIPFDIVHINTGNDVFQRRVLLLCASCGIRMRIVHSHSYWPIDHLRVKQRIKRCAKLCIINLLATRRVACSQRAADYLFGKHFARKAIILSNKIDTKKFAFSPAIRQSYRERMNFQDALVIGHVGVINGQKNHDFLIDVFYELAQNDERVRLLLVGDGILEAKIRQKVAAYHLEDKVIFTGITNVVNEYLCAMDLFVFPSLHEGFGNVTIEAQASGLPCLVSDRVPPEVKATNELQFMPLELGSKAWAAKLLEIIPNGDAKRSDAWKTVRSAEFDLDQLPEFIDRIYG